MPYQGELANKVAHVDIVKNPEVAEFLKECRYLTPPTEDQIPSMISVFQRSPNFVDVELPGNLIAVDGSYHESSIDDELPSTKVGYVKIGSVLIDLSQYNSLRVMEGKYVDPFRVARLQDNNSPLTFALPSANLHFEGKASVRDSFRAKIDSDLYSLKTRFRAEDPTTSLRTTLFHLAALRQGVLGTNDPSKIMIHKCPSCEEGPIELRDIPDQQHCPYCNGEVYPSDCLRLWEEVEDYQSNVQALSRFMQQVEHLLPIHYMRYLASVSLPTLAATAFVIDGPLAVFGNGAWLHSCIMRFLYDMNMRLESMGLPNLLVMGIQKTGQVVDHFRLISRFLDTNVIFPITDDYRYQYILPGREPSKNGFGSETYYGQDFLYKTSSGREFVFALSYPFPNKTLAQSDFTVEKVQISRYKTVHQALKVIEHFESDLYENSLVPVALAHRYTAISLVPGGKVLDLLTRSALNGRQYGNGS